MICTEVTEIRRRCGYGDRKIGLKGEKKEQERVSVIERLKENQEIIRRQEEQRRQQQQAQKMKRRKEEL